MKFKIIGMLLMMLGWLHFLSPAQLGMEMNWTFPIDRFARQSLPGTVLHDGRNNLLDMNKGILFGPRLFWEFNHDLRLNLGFQAGFRRVRIRYAEGRFFFGRRERLRTAMLPVSLAWTPAIRNSKFWRWNFAAGGGLLWYDRFRMHNKFGWRQIGVPNAEGIDGESNLTITRKSQSSPAGFLSASAGVECSFKGEGGLRLAATYHWVMHPSLRLVGDFRVNLSEETFARTFRGNFLGLEMAFVPPFRVGGRK